MRTASSSAARAANSFTFAIQVIKGKFRALRGGRNLVARQGRLPPASSPALCPRSGCAGTSAPQLARRSGRQRPAADTSRQRRYPTAACENVRPQVVGCCACLSRCDPSGPDVRLDDQAAKDPRAAGRHETSQPGRRDSRPASSCHVVTNKGSGSAEYSSRRTPALRYSRDRPCPSRSR